MNTLVYADDVADDMLVLRHEKDLNGCRGKVEDGVCKKCGCSTPGVHCFKFEVVLADLNNAEVLLPIMGADGIGSSLFRTHVVQKRRLWSLEKASTAFSIFHILYHSLHLPSIFLCRSIDKK